MDLTPDKWLLSLTYQVLLQRSKVNNTEGKRKKDKTGSLKGNENGQTYVKVQETTSFIFQMSHHQRLITPHVG